MATSTTTKHLFRSVLRELRLASNKPRVQRNRAVTDTVRDTAKSGFGQVDGVLLETRDFLRASRVHGELLRRYNPLSDMSEEERIHATARRVGLDTPVQYKPE